MNALAPRIEFFSTESDWPTSEDAILAEGIASAWRTTWGGGMILSVYATDAARVEALNLPLDRVVVVA